MGEQSFLAEVTSQGRVTIPFIIRKALKLKEGDIMKVTVEKKPIGRSEKPLKEAED